MQSPSNTEHGLRQATLTQHAHPPYCLHELVLAALQANSDLKEMLIGIRDRLFLRAYRLVPFWVSRLFIYVPLYVPQSKHHG